MDTLSDDNISFKFRKSLLKTSNIVEFIGKIHSELFNQERLLLSNVDMKLAFTRHNDNFCLMAAAADAVKIQLIDAWLMIRRNKLSSHKVIEIESTLLFYSSRRGENVYICCRLAGYSSEKQRNEKRHTKSHCGSHGVQYRLQREQTVESIQFQAS